MPNWLRLRSFQGPGLLIVDAVSLYLAIGIVHDLRLGRWVATDASLMLVGFGVLTGLYVMNVYHFPRQGEPVRHALRTFAAVAASGALIAAFVYVTKTTAATTVLWRGNLPLSLFGFALWASLIRYFGTVVFAELARAPRWLVVGSAACGDALKRDYVSSGLDGEFDRVPGEDAVLDTVTLKFDGPSLVVANPEAHELYRGRVSGIVLEDSRAISERFTTQLMHTRLRGIPVLELSDFYEQNLLRVPVMELKARWFALSRGFSLVHRDVELKIKRVLDVVISILGLVLCSPLLLIVGVLVRATSRGPALYSQTRCGMRNRTFSLHKFRTMVDDAEQHGAQWSQPGDERITLTGRFLRKTRIDELPQLWNVLVGEMSFIGPRPERPDFVTALERDIPYYELRHLVKPGITGWAQVMYPYGSSKDDAKNKLEFDLYYIKNYSLALDLYILIRTVRVVFSRTGR